MSVSFVPPVGSLQKQRRLRPLPSACSSQRSPAVRRTHVLPESPNPGRRHGDGGAGRHNSLALLFVSRICADFEPKWRKRRWRRVAEVSRPISGGGGEDSGRFGRTRASGGSGVPGEGCSQPLLRCSPSFPHLLSDAPASTSADARSAEPGRSPGAWTSKPPSEGDQSAGGKAGERGG